MPPASRIRKIRISFSFSSSNLLGRRFTQIHAEKKNDPLPFVYFSFVFAFILKICVHLRPKNEMNGLTSVSLPLAIRTRA